MKEPDYKTFWDTLPHILLMRSRADLQDEFRREYREEILGALQMLHRLGVAWGPTRLHPDPPDACDICGIALSECQLFVDGSTPDRLWANMCPKCFLEEGHSIGWGKGQLYLSVSDGRWRLVAGGDPEARDADSD